MRVAVLHAGGLGDLVLAETLFAALRERRPQARIELICREDVAPVATLYTTPPDAIHRFAFDPYRWDVPSAAVAAQIRDVAERIGDGVDVLVCAELRATWLGDGLAALLEPGETIAGDPLERRTTDVAVLLRRLGRRPSAVVRRIAAVDGEHELDRYARLAGTAARRLPALRAPAPRTRRAAWLAVFPFGAVAIKQWPLERTVGAATRIAARLEAGITLVGSKADRPRLKQVAARFDGATELLTADAAGLPALAARLAGATGYVGIDSGPAHLAAAYGVPGVTVYGGGHWPAYAPWRATSAGVVAPIPCFGCGWDCAFDHAFCIDAIEEDAVVAAFDAAIEPGRDLPAVVELGAYAPRERAILAAAGAVHRTAQADRAARLVAITGVRDVLQRYAGRTRTRYVGTAAELAAQRARAADLQRECDRRSTVIEDLERYVITLRTAADERIAAIGTLDTTLRQERERFALVDVELEVLRRTCDERSAVIRRLADENEGLRSIAEERAKLLEFNESAYAQRAAHNADWRAVADARGDELVALQQACEERSALIERLAAENEALHAVAEERATLLEFNESAYAQREARHADWRGVAEERERALTATAHEAERRAVLLADLTAAYEAKVREVEELRGLVPRAL